MRSHLPNRQILAGVLFAVLMTACGAPQGATKPTPIPVAPTTAPAATAAPTAVAPAGAPPAGMPAGAPPGAPPGAPAGAPPGAPPGGFGGGQTFAATPAFANVVYASTSATQKLDIYLPQGSGPFPVVVNIHAGGFTFMDKSAIPGTIGQALLDAGYAVVGIDYRLSGEAAFPAAVLDVRAAIRFLRANATQYQLDPNRMAAFGQSAGGNLAAMLGTTGTSTTFDDASLGNARVSSAVQVVVTWFGPTDFGQMDAQAKAQGCAASDQTHSEASSFESAYLGAPVASAPDRVAKANPITYIAGQSAAGIPPFLVQKGDQDCTVAIANTKMLADALQAAGATVEYDLLAGAGHGDTGSTPVFEGTANIQRVITFLTTHLK